MDSNFPVPRENGYRSESSGFVYLPETVRVSSKDLPTSGTEVSNPLPSSGESSANLTSAAKAWKGDSSLGEMVPYEIGISPSLSPKFPLLSVPYGCLVPRDIDGLLVAGRHISCDPSSHSFLREIPQCWLTGQAAGVAAALAGAERCAPRTVPIAELQAALRRQQVLLRAEGEPALAPAGETAEAKS